MSEATLRALAAGLCADRGLRLRLGRTWAYHPGSHAIEVPEAQLDELGPVACAGVVAHEVGHAWLSRYDAFAPTGIIPMATLLALNAFEDGRVERWMTRRYPGVARWLAEATAHGADEPGTPLLSFLVACVREAAGLPSRVRSPLVQVALETTVAARRAYVTDFLPDAALHPPSDATTLWDQEVAPHDRYDAPADDREAWVRVLAFRALSHARNELLPWVERLLDQEVHSVACALRHADGASSDAGFVQRTLADHLHQRCEEPTLVRRATALLRRFYEGALGAGTPCIRGSVLGAPRNLGDAPVRYAELLADTVAVRRGLLEVLRPAFPPAGRPPNGRVANRGARVSLRHALAAQADPRLGTRVFARPSTPQRPHPAFTLLLDLSGSMCGPPIASALRAVVAVAEVLDELSIPFAVDGFQDERIPVLAHGQQLTAARRQHIADLALEVSGSRPGGHNVQGYNDDGPCLLEAAELLGRVPADSRWLLVVSDGRPHGRRSTEEDLRAAIAQVGRMRSRVHLLGLGLGPDAMHVEELYPRSVAGIELEELPGRLAQVVRVCLQTRGMDLQTSSRHRAK